jgi:enoyl-CoA hydratase
MTDVASAVDAQPRADIQIVNSGAAAVVTLDRAGALNALTIDMRSRLAAMFPRAARDPNTYAVVLQSASAKAFSAGGDVRELIALARRDMPAARRALADEYSLNWLHECFSKPTISLIDGVLMGSGVGITAYGTHRVAGEKYRFAMPETAIGLFPDVGAAHVLSRLSNAVGMYLGLTGRLIGRADAYRLGLVTHCIPAAEFPAIVAGLSAADPVDPLLDDRHADPGQGELAKVESVIARTFSAPTVEEIVERLKAETGEHAPWAEAVLAELGEKSPVSLKVTHRHIAEAAGRDLRETLQVDYRLACRFLEHPDFAEGVRAALIDKDRNPSWQPAHLEQVTASMVDEFFAPMGDADLALPTRKEMQAARV